MKYLRGSPACRNQWLGRLELLTPSVMSRMSKPEQRGNALLALGDGFVPSLLTDCSLGHVGEELGHPPGCCQSSGCSE